MSPTDQRADASAPAHAPAPADAAVPAEHEVPSKLALAAEFDAATREQWRELVAGVLRKAGREELPDPVEEALARTVATGVRVLPLYTADDAADLPTAVGVPGLAPFVRRARAGAHPESGVPGGWDVRQRHAHPDVAVTREAIAADLENGVTSLWLVVGEGAVPAGELGPVLSDVLLDLAPVAVTGGLPAAEAFLALVEGRDDLAAGGSLGLDPLAVHAATGEPQDLSGLADVARRAAAHKAGRPRPALRTVVVDATVFHDAGASVVEEIGCSLAAGVAYLRALTEGGLSVDEAFAQLEFRYGATADQFTTIAGLRAARRLWDRVGEVSGAAPEARAQRQHAVTSSVMTTKRDPWVNMLRTTVACFAAGVDGADVVTVQPFDAALGLPDPFSRRIARNTQSLLVEEGHLARVLDPAGSRSSASTSTGSTPTRPSRCCAWTTPTSSPSRRPSSPSCGPPATPVPCRSACAGSPTPPARRPRDGGGTTWTATCSSSPSTPPAPRPPSARSPTRWRRSTDGTPARSAPSPVCTATRQESTGPWTRPAA
jgi:methylmalonyl-CoA mutase